MHRTSGGCESAVKVIVTFCEGLLSFALGEVHAGSAAYSTLAIAN